MAKLITELGGLWNPWYLLNTHIKIEGGDSIAIPHASIPTSYLPSKSFRTQAFASHCYLEDLCLPIGTGLHNVFIGRSPSLSSINILKEEIDELINGLSSETAITVRGWVRGVLSGRFSFGKPDGANDAENLIIDRIEEILQKIAAIKDYYDNWTPPDNIWESSSGSESSQSDSEEEIIEEPDHFTYKCRWDAENNSPRLVNGIGKIRDVYLVSNNGSQDFGDGSISFVAGDFVMYDYDDYGGSEEETEEDGKWIKVPLWDASINIPVLRHGFVDHGHRVYIVSKDGIQNLNPPDSSTSSSSDSEFGNRGYDGGQKPQPFFKGDWVFYNDRKWWENTRYTSLKRHRFNIEWGIDGQYPNAPELGYCVGDDYCELLYSRSVFSGKYNGNYSSGGIKHNTYMDVFQRARSRRMYIHHGAVSKYEAITEDDEETVVHILKLDIDDKIKNYEAEELQSASITIFKADSNASFDITIVEVLEDLSFVINEPEANISIGDFYLFNSIYCIRDPYLLTGFYVGTEDTENDKKTLLEDEEGYADDYGGDSPNGFKMPNGSGFNLHITTKNVFFDNVFFTGAFVFKDENGNVIINDSDTLFDEGLAKWHWIPIEGSGKSEVYKNVTDRYSESTRLNRGTWRIPSEDESEESEESGLIDDEFSEEEDYSSDYEPPTGIIVKFNTAPLSSRPRGTQGDITDLINLGAVSIRLEINHGGDHLRNNWHSPHLAKNWLNQNGKYFKIIRHPDGNVIDVSIKDVTNTSTLNIYAEGSILNHYGWFISEHFAIKSNDAFFGYDYSSAIGTLTIPEVANSEDDDLSSESGDDDMERLGVYGIFGGNIDSIADIAGIVPLTKIVIATHGESKGTISRNTTYYNPNVLKEVNSFYNRFRVDYYEGAPIKLWEKYEGWKLVREDLRSGAKIVDIIFQPEFPDKNWTEGEIQVIIESGNWTVEDLNKMCWFVFDEPYIINNEDIKYVTGDLHTRYGFVPEIEESESSYGSEYGDDETPPYESEDDDDDEIEESYSSDSSQSGTSSSTSESSMSDDDTSTESIVSDSDESGGGGDEESEEEGGGGGDFSFEYDSSSEPYCIEMNYINLPIKEKIPRSVIVGVCGGKWWGVFDIYDFTFTRSNNGLPLFISTQLFVPPGMTSFYNALVQQDWVIYFDSFTEKMTARVGQLRFTSQPRKIEISCGLTRASQPSSFPISPNTRYDRIKTIGMNLPEGEIGACTFFIGEINDYHGFIINGEGIVDLPRLTGQDEDVSPDDFKFKNDYVSPVYIEMDGSTSRKTMHLGMSTKYGQVYANNADPSNVTVQYINSNQTFEPNSYICSHNLSDGEKIIVFSRKIGVFTDVDDNTYNDDNSKWDNQNCIFIIGTTDNGNNWMCPNILKSSQTFEDKYQWALMVLNATDFLCSIYNELSQTLIIICKSTDENKNVYLGAFSVSLSSLIYKTVLFRENPDFLWRPPILAGVEWTNASNAIEIELEEGEEVTRFQDRFVKIIGGLETGSQIEDESVKFFTNFSGVMSKDGIVRLFYTSRGSIRMLFSSTSGYIWKNSEIRFAYSSNSALCIGNVLFYITKNGIEMKNFGDSHFNNAYKSIAGVDEDFIELIQLEFNALKKVLIYSGEIESQQLTGYKDSQGVYYIFYYDNEGNLSSLTSHDRVVWKSTPNF